MPVDFDTTKYVKPVKTCAQVPAMDFTEALQMMEEVN